MSSLYNKIRSERPNIKETSIRAYVTNIKKVQSGLGLDDTDNIDFLKNYDKVLSYLNTIDKITTRKNIIAAIVVTLKAFKYNEELVSKYSAPMKELNSKYFHTLEEQKMTPRQRENWVDYSDIVALANAILNKVIEFKDEPTLSPQQLKLLQDLVILRSYLIAPARNNYATMKVITLDQYNKLPNGGTDNYLVVDNGMVEPMPIMFVLNSYKNSNHLGTKKININTDTGNIIKLWLRHNKTGYFLINGQGRPLTPNHLTKYLKHIFQTHMGKDISSSMIRHIMITHFQEGTPTIKQDAEKEKQIENMFQHSSRMNNLYRKVA